MFDKVFALTDGLSHELSFKSLEVRHLDKAYSFYHYFFQEAADVRPPICLEPVTAAFSAAVPAKLPFIPLPAWERFSRLESDSCDNEQNMSTS